MAAQLYSFSVAGMMELQKDVTQRGKGPAKALAYGAAAGGLDETGVVSAV